MGSLNYPVLYKTDETVDQVKDRLSARCEGTWSVEVESTDAASNRRNLRVVFARESDIRSLLRPAAGR